MRPGWYMVLLPALAAIAITVGSANADATSEARKGIASAYRRMNAAAARKDVDGMFGSYAPDYFELDAAGKRHMLEEVKRPLARLIPIAKSVTAKTVIVSVTLKGDTAAVVSRDHTEIIFQNPRDPADVRKLVSDITSEDTWSRTPKGWFQKTSKNLSYKQTVNGKPI